MHCISPISSYWACAIIPLNKNAHTERSPNKRQIVYAGNMLNSRDITETEKIVVEKYSNQFPTAIFLGWILGLFAYVGSVLSCLFLNFTITGGVIVTILSSFLMFPCMHGATHGHFRGRDGKHKMLNNIVGHSAANIAQFSFTQYKNLHMDHHKYTNIKGSDPDYVQLKSYWSLVVYTVSSYVIQVLLAIPVINKIVMNKIPRFARERIKKYTTSFSVWQVRVTYMAFLVSIYAGYGKYIFWLWLFPHFINRTRLIILFMWLPHRHGETSAFRDTRIQITPILGNAKYHRLWKATLFAREMDYHLVHHLYPSIILPNLEKAFTELSDILMDNQSIIVKRFTGAPWHSIK